MAGIRLQTSRKVVPMIYAYSTPEIARLNGWVKIGYTERQSVEDRIKQQTHTAQVRAKEEWRSTAVYDDGTFDPFTDRDFHAYLEKLGVEREPKTEWFHIDGARSRELFNEFRANRGNVGKGAIKVARYALRNEQNEAVEQTLAAEAAGRDEFLWNAKPRFGKTLTVYDFVKRFGAKRALVVTNRPAVANSWYDDYERFLGSDSGYLFVSETDALRKRPLVMTPKDFDARPRKVGEPEPKRIEFVSLQDMKGSLYFGGEYDKLKHLEEIDWDVLVIDEAHEGVDTRKTDAAFERIKRRFTLHLSGTPFKALANDKFPPDAIYNWTYADEQRAKRDWTGESSKESRSTGRTTTTPTT